MSRCRVPYDSRKEGDSDGTAASERPLSTEQRRALAMLADAGQNGVTEAGMLANGFETKMLARLDREGLATAKIAERVEDGGRVIEVVCI